MQRTKKIQQTIAAMVLSAGLVTAQQGAAPANHTQGRGYAGSTAAPATSQPANPGYGPQVPNNELSGNTPATNSSYQVGRNGHLKMGIGWLGLLGLAGLFGLRRIPE